MMSPADTSPTSSAEPLDDAQYFRAARAYASFMYDGPIIERSFALLALAVLLMALLTNVLIISSLYPLNKPMRMMFENPMSGIELPRVVRISPDRAPLQIAVARYSLEYYAKAFESYSYSQEDITAAYRFIQNNSAPELTLRYNAKLNASDPNSDVSKLGQMGKRHIENVATQLKDMGEKNGVITYHATLSFDTVTRTAERIIRQRQQRTAEILMYKLEIPKGKKSVYQYNPKTGTEERLFGRIGFRVVRYQ